MFVVNLYQLSVKEAQVLTRHLQPATSPCVCPLPVWSGRCGPRRHGTNSWLCLQPQGVWVEQWWLDLCSFRDQSSQRQTGHVSQHWAAGQMWRRRKLETHTHTLLPLFSTRSLKWATEKQPERDNTSSMEESKMIRIWLFSVRLLEPVFHTHFIPPHSDNSTCKTTAISISRSVLTCRITLQN